MVKQSSRHSERHGGNRIAWLRAAVRATSLEDVVVLGIAGARAGGAPPVKAARVVFLGAQAMAVTVLIGGMMRATL